MDDAQAFAQDFDDESSFADAGEYEFTFPVSLLNLPTEFFPADTLKIAARGFSLWRWHLEWLLEIHR